MNTKCGLQKLKIEKINIKNNKCKSEKKKLIIINHSIFYHLATFWIISNLRNLLNHVSNDLFLHLIVKNNCSILIGSLVNSEKEVKHKKGIDISNKRKI